jgi:hypothetical protein
MPLNNRYQYPSIETGYVSAASGELTVNGQVYSGSPQVTQYRAAGGGPVVSVKVGRKQAILGSGGFYVPKTTH